MADEDKGSKSSTMRIWWLGGWGRGGGGPAVEWGGRRLTVPRRGNYDLEGQNSIFQTKTRDLKKRHRKW